MVDSIQCRIGFVSTRFAGTDGVSLETSKWSSVLTELGHECFYFAGELDRPEDRTYLVPEAHFVHPRVVEITTDLFDDYTRSSQTSGKVQALRFFLKEELYKFVHRFDIDLLIVENVLSLPVHVPLGLALTEFVAETNIHTIAHHHDFAWERARFKVSAATDYLLGAFPPILPFVHHVVINSAAGWELARRTGASYTLIPNVMDFDHPPDEPDGYGDDLREVLGIEPNEYLLLQPTRIVPRKRIEHAIELARRIELECVLLFTHSVGDEGNDYESYLKNYAKLMGVKVIFAADRFSYQRGETDGHQKVYSLSDAYQQADLITYPSAVEGFGNAFLEAIFYRRPIVMSAYEIYRIDIQPKGFNVIAFVDVIDEDTVRNTREVLTRPELATRIVNENYELGRRFYSYGILRHRLIALIGECRGI